MLSHIDQNESIYTIKKLNRFAMVYDMKSTMEEITDENLQQAISFNEADKNITDMDQQKKLIDMKEAIVSQLMVATDMQKSIGEAYPDLVNEAKIRKASLDKDANRSGLDKAKNDLLGFNKRAAKKKLKKIEEKQRIYNENFNNPQEDIEKLYQEKRFNKQRKLNDADSSKGLFAHMVNYAVHRSESTRRNKSQTQEYKNIIEQRLAKPITIKSSDERSSLKGHVFTPNIKWNKKVVIIYGGSADPNHAQNGMAKNIESYLNNGFKVYQVDYRGYGESGVKKENGKFESFSVTEKTLYQDGEDILKFAADDSNVSMSKIILHGYSMGGSVASRVAAKIARDVNLRKLKGEKVGKKEKLGGLVMDSPMHNMYGIVKNLCGNDTLASCAQWAAGKYSTEDHLGVLHDNQPDIPILFVSGRENDHISLDVTNIDKKYKFTNSTTSKVKRGHMDSHISDNVIYKKFEKGKK